MHMLHSRRKAEIEIISSSKPLQQPHRGKPMDFGIQDDFQRTYPLLNYLLEKIIAFIDLYAA